MGLADAVEVARDRNIETGDLLALGVEEIHVGLATELPMMNARRDDRTTAFGDLRIGDQHVLDVARQIDNDRFTDPKGHRLRLIIACGDVDGLRRAAC